MQTLDIDASLANASWGLARVIRRNAPWNVQRPRFPVSTFFDCVRSGLGVDIYHIDSGIDTTHAETAGRVTNVYNQFGTDGVQNGDDHGHGTSSASAAAGETCGLARSALLWTFKIYNSAGGATSQGIINALTEALTHYTGRAATNRPGVVCANFSIADIAVASKIDDMINAGMVVVCSVHNYGRDVAVDNFYPAVQADVIGVGGIGFCDTPYYLGVSADEFGAPQIGTGFGTPVDILAPAQSLRLANASVLGGGYRVYSGNSFSCPFVTGAVACMLEGKARITTRAGVQAVITKLLANATTGKLRPGFGLAPLPDKILYLDPAVSTETI